MIIITAARLRYIIRECKTDADIQATLKYHKVRHKYETTGNVFGVTVPTATGSVRIIRTASKACPFTIQPVSPEPFYRPVHHFEY